MRGDVTDSGIMRVLSKICDIVCLNVLWLVCSLADHYDRSIDNSVVYSNAETCKNEEGYILKNLGCAHCAAKMEHRIKELPGVEYANISYVTKQLRLSAVNHEAVLPAIKEICTSIESGVEVVPREGEGPFNFKTQVYVLENLGCANCAAKMERAINELPQVSEATITFATKQLKVTARDFDGLLPQMQKSAPA